MPSTTFPPQALPTSTGTASSSADLARLHRALMERPDPRDRAQVHLELARLHLTEGQVEASVRHLREALVLDRRLEAARRLLADLGESSRVDDGAHRGRDRRSAVRSLLGRFRR